jgi:hypothetical protein
MKLSTGFLKAIFLGSCLSMVLVWKLASPASVTPSPLGLQEIRRSPETDSSVYSPPKTISNKLLPPKSVEKNPARFREDDDLLGFIKKMVGSPLTEEMVLALLKSPLSPNKKAVLLSLYTRRGGVYRSPAWQPLLLSLIEGSNPWPELANKASDGLAQGNVDGQGDPEILETLGRQGQDTEVDVIKRTALAYALHGKDAIERAKANATSEPEETLLTQKHAGLLTQAERLDAYQTQTDSVLKTIYLGSFLKNAQTTEEISRGLSLGLADPLVLPIDRPALYLAASEAPWSGKTEILLEHWKGFAKRQKEGLDLTSSSLQAVLSIAIQKAAFSEADPKAVLEILAILKTLGPFTSADSRDLRVTLALLMVQGCRDPLVKKHLCPGLADELQSLKNQLERDGLGAYL